MAFIGVDLHSNSFTVCRLDPDGAERFETFGLSPADIERFCLGLDADDEIAVEATSNAAWFCGGIRPCVGGIVVMNPCKFEVIRRSASKTDRNDARALAFVLLKDMLPQTRLSSTDEAEMGSLVHSCDLLVKQRTMLLDKIHALFARHGWKLKKEGLTGRKRLRELDLDRAIEAAGAKLDGFERLTGIKGIGPRSAAILLAGIGSLDDFENADKLAAYFGTVPRVSQFNETDTRCRITKRGDKLIRTTLVQCALVARNYSGYLNAFYQRIKERRGAGTAIIATVRKVLSIIYRTLRNGWVYEDFTQFKIKEKQSPTGQPS